LLGLVWLYVRVRRRSWLGRWFYWAVLAAGPLSVVAALIAGGLTVPAAAADRARLVVLNPDLGVSSG
jgi:hypothetical protein